MCKARLIVSWPFEFHSKKQTVLSHHPVAVGYKPWLGEQEQDAEIEEKIIGARQVVRAPAKLSKVCYMTPVPTKKQDGRGKAGT